MENTTLHGHGARLASVFIVVAPSSSRTLLSSVRWGLTFALAYLVLWDQNDSVGPGELAFIAVLLGSNLLLPRVERWLGTERASALLICSDAVLVLIGLSFADSASQDLVIGALLCLIIATLADDEGRLVGLAVLVPGIYALYEMRTIAGNVLQPAILLRLPLLCFATLTYGLLVARIRTETRARERAEHRAGTLETLLSLTRSLSSTLDSTTILDRARATLATLPEIASVEILDGTRVVNSRSAPIHEAITSGRPRVARGETGDSLSVVAVPLRHGAERLGAIWIALAPGRTEVSTDRLELFEIVADATALALTNARQYEDLTEAERTKMEFLRNLSHEMHTPLHAILGFREIAAEAIEQSDLETARHALGRIDERGREMAGHVESLLELSRLTLGKETVRPTAVDVSALLERCVRETCGGGDTAVEFRLHVAPEAARAFVDGDKVERIVRCLLSNAAKFGERGAVEVDAAIQAADGANGTGDGSPLLRLRVSDRGIGLDGSTLTRAFDDFRQGDGSITRRYSGLGLGLAISRRLAHLLGGTVNVDSAPGRGSRFEVLLPAHPSSTAPSTLSASAPAVAAAHG